MKVDEKPQEGETLLDHRTFLEDKISDKFFGGSLNTYLFIHPWQGPTDPQQIGITMPPSSSLLVSCPGLSQCWEVGSAGSSW